RQIDAGDHVDLAVAENGNGEVGRRAAEHVGQQDDTVSIVDHADRFDDVAPARLGIVVRPDADGACLILCAHDMLGGGEQLLGQPTVGDQYHADHADSLYAVRGSG